MSTTTEQFRWQAVGRRKTSVARVYLTPGTGKWDVNGRTLGDYFPRPRWCSTSSSRSPPPTPSARSTSRRTWMAAAWPGQAGAMRHAIARALVAGR